MSKKFYGNYRGIVVQNNDPQYLGRVKVFVPSVNANILENWTNAFTNDNTINHLGSNVNGFDAEILTRLKKILPWSETVQPLFGMGTGGFFESASHNSFIGNGNLLTPQQKKPCNYESASQKFRETGSVKNTDLVTRTDKLTSVQSTVYGYPSDPYLDSNSAKGIGNRNNKLSNNSSVALMEETARSLGLSRGDSVLVTFPDGKKGIYKYDDTIPSDYSNHRVDFYMKTDADKSSWNYDGANLTLEKYTPQNTPPSEEGTTNDIITPPNFVEKDSCNQSGSGGSAFANNKADNRNYLGGDNIENQTKNSYGSTTYRNPNNYSGRNSVIVDETRALRGLNHSNNYKGCLSIPGVGSHVWVFFEEGDPTLPVVWGYHANQEAYMGVHGITNYDKSSQYF